LLELAVDRLEASDDVLVQASAGASTRVLPVGLNSFSEGIELENYTCSIE